MIVALISAPRLVSVSALILSFLFGYAFPCLICNFPLENTYKKGRGRSYLLKRKRQRKVILTTRK